VGKKSRACRNSVEISMVYQLTAVESSGTGHPAEAKKYRYSFPDYGT
jgi:hypothetical protein